MSLVENTQKFMISFTNRELDSKIYQLPLGVYQKDREGFEIKKVCMSSLAPSYLLSQYENQLLVQQRLSLSKGTIRESKFITKQSFQLTPSFTSLEIRLSIEGAFHLLQARIIHADFTSSTYNPKNHF